MTDSGNSTGSSSGGEEEYDSRAAATISPFLTNHGLPRHPPPQLHHNQAAAAALHTSPMFDPLSNFFDPLTRSSTQSPILNLDMASWTKNHPRPTSCTGDLSSFGMTPMQLQPLLVGGGGGGTAGFSVPSGPDGSKQLGSVSASSDQDAGAVNNSNNISSTTTSSVTATATATRNPKKRSRASRRAPTTVLSTDTTNFRAMVQEFTGIPNGPFANSAFQRSRLDLFGSASGAPSFLLRPFAQKLQQTSPLVPPFMSPPPPPPPSSSNSNSSTSNFPALIDALASSATTHVTTSNSSHGLLNVSPQNPILDFQSLFQGPHKYLAGSSIFPGKSLGLDEFGLGHAQVSTQLQAGLPNVDSSHRTLPENSIDNTPSSWHGDAGGPNDGAPSINILRTLGGSYGASPSPRGVNGKMNYSGPSPPSSEFHGDRGTENAGARGEGMVESWICSSD